MMPAIANHLWQSTLFAAASWLLTLVLRGAPARARYWVWMAASVKFLLPFSLFIAIGSQVHWRTAPTIAGDRISLFVEELAAPLAPVSPGAPAKQPTPLYFWLPGTLAAVCLFGARWNRVRRLVRTAAPLPLELPIPALAAAGLPEPGIFGILRPVLLLPAGIDRRLTAAQLRAIVAHELCHVRRRDNLAALFHMAVEAIFWFHPLVWWLGARLVEERENACDEDVLQLGNSPETYAESILAACRHYFESPLPCVAGVTGGKLNQRIERILTQRGMPPFDRGKRLLLAAAATACLAGPIAIGLLDAAPGRAPSQDSAAPPMAFEVASVKQSAPNVRGYNLQTLPGGRLLVRNATLLNIIALAYDVEFEPYRVEGAPGWVNSARYDIDAKAGDPKASKHDMRRMLQSLLAERFHVAVHKETKDLPVYALVVAKSGPKLQPPKDPNGPHGVDFRGGGLQLIGHNASMDELAEAVAFRVQRTVINRTAVAGGHDFKLAFTPDEVVSRFGDDTPTAVDSNGTSIFTALQEQLGLKLESGKGPVELVVIDRVDRPTVN